MTTLHSRERWLLKKDSRRKVLASQGLVTVIVHVHNFDCLLQMYISLYIHELVRTNNKVASFQEVLSVIEVGTVGTFKPNPHTRRKEQLKNIPCKVHSILGTRLRVELLDRQFEPLPTTEKSLIDINANQFRPGT